MEIVQAHQHKKFEVFFVANLPKNKAETHLQKIFETHYSGSLICLNKSRGKSKKQNVTAVVTIPMKIVEAEPLLQEALASDRGVPICLPPLPKLYFRRKEQPKASTDAVVVKLQKELEVLKITIKEMEARHLNEMNAVRVELAKSVQAQMRQSEQLEKNLAAQEKMRSSMSQVCEYIHSLQSHHV